MTPKQTNADKSKGFTLVELLVTISIIAILATVSVVGYVSFINSAERSADEQLAVQMNIVLAANEILEKPLHISEVQQLLGDEAVSDFTAQSKSCAFYWASDLNRILIWERESEESTQGKVVFPEDLADSLGSQTEIPAGWYALSAKYLNEDDGQAELLALIEAAEPNGDVIVLPKGKLLKVDALALSNSLSTHKLDHGTSTSLTFDLNGGELQLGENSLGEYHNFTIFENIQVEFINGNIELLDNASTIFVKPNSALALREVNLKADAAAFSNAITASSEAKAIVIDSSSITCSGYAVSTTNSASTLNISVSNSTIDGNTPFLITAPCSLNIYNSTVKGHNQAIIVRGGNATLRNNEIYNCFDTAAVAEENWNCFFPDFGSNPKYNTWQNGNMVPVAAVTVGNEAGNAAFPYPTDCVLENNEIHVIKGYMAVYIEGASEENKATLTASGNKYFYHEDDTYTDGKQFGSDTPVEYNKDLYANGNLINDAAIICSSKQNSFVEIK